MLVFIHILLIIFYISLLIELTWFSVPSPASNWQLQKKARQSPFWFIFSALGLLAFVLPLFYLISFFFNVHIFKVNALKLFLVAGLILIIAGRILTFAAGVQIKNHLEQKESIVLDKGMFKFSRHPIALGLMITLLGLNFILPSFIMIVLSIVFIFDLHRKVLMEEKFLFHQFAESYKNYCKKTNRYL